MPKLTWGPAVVVGLALGAIAVSYGLPIVPALALAALLIPVFAFLTCVGWERR